MAADCSRAPHGSPLHFLGLRLVLVAIVAVALWLENPFGAIGLRLEIGLGLAVISLLPMLATLARIGHRSEGRFVVFEYHLVFIGVLFGLSEVIPARNPLHVYADADIRMAGALVLLYIVVAAVVHRQLILSWRIGAATPEAVIAPIPVRGAAWLVGYYFVALIVQQATRSLSTLGSFTMFVEWTLRIALVFIAFSPHQPRGSRLVCSVGVIGSIGLALSSGLFGPIAITLAFGICGRLSSPKVGVGLSAPFRVLAGFATVAIAAVALQLASAAQLVKDRYRAEAWRGGLSGESVSVKLSYQLDLMGEELSDDSNGGVVKRGLEPLAGRLQTLPVFAHAIHKTPSVIPYEDGATYSSLLYVMIPRFLWPSKPTFNLGNSWGRRWGLLNSTNFTTSLNLHALIEGYLNFGYLGVVFAAVVVALVCAVWEWVFLTSAANVVARAGLASLMTPFVWPESDLGLSLGLLATWSVFYLVSMPVLLRLLPKSLRTSRSTGLAARRIP